MCPFNTGTCLTTEQVKDECWQAIDSPWHSIISPVLKARKQRLREVKNCFNKINYKIKIASKPFQSLHSSHFAIKFTKDKNYTSDIFYTANEVQFDPTDSKSLPTSMFTRSKNCFRHRALTMLAMEGFMGHQYG